MVGIAKVLAAMAVAVLSEALAPDHARGAYLPQHAHSLRHVAADTNQEKTEQHDSFLGFPDGKPYDPKKKTDSTANPQVCTAIYITMMVGLVIMVVGEYVLGDQKVQIAGLCVAGPGTIAATFYAFYHGIVSDWWEGGHNLTDQCNGVAGAAVVMYFFICVFACFGSAFAVKSGLEVVTKMRKATLERVASLPDTEKAYLNSEDFKKKCKAIFLEADKNHDGVLDPTELKQFVLKEFPKVQQAKLQNDELFKETFDKWDEKKSGTIDQEEFVAVMKYCRAHAVI